MTGVISSLKWLCLALVILSGRSTEARSAQHSVVVPVPDAPEAGTLSISATGTLHPVSQDLWGIFFEEINHAGVGGLYSQQIANSNFETILEDFAPWYVLPAASADYYISLTQAYPLSLESPTALQITVNSATPGVPVGAVNPGFWGISVNGAGFNFALWARSDNSSVTDATVSVTSKDGKTSYGNTKISGITDQWQMFNGTITTSAVGDASAVFTVSWNALGTAPQSLFLDVVTLFPIESFAGLGFIRQDLGTYVANLHPAFVRFPGGCYVEGDRLFDRFNWKKALGELHHRRGHWNLWGYFSEDGLGLLEYLSFVEKLTDVYGNPTRAIWVVNVGVSHSESIATQNIDGWIADALHSLEFALGDANSYWGGLRAQAGHPAPFDNLKYVALGNEDCGKPDYNTNYQAFFKAVSAAYPNLTLIANCDLTPIPTQLWDYHIYTSSGDFYNQQFTFDDTKKYPRTGAKIFNSEYAVTSNVGRGNLNAALGEAAWMTGLERNSDLVTTASYAPLFVNDNNRAWNPDAIVFNSGALYGTPSYWLQQLFSNSYAGAAAGSVNTLTYTMTNNIDVSASVTKATVSQQSANRMYVIKIVSYGNSTQAITIQLNNYPSTGTLQANAQLITLTAPGGNIAAENSFAVPNNVVPVMSTYQVTTNFVFPAAPNTIYVLRIYSQE